MRAIRFAAAALLLAAPAAAQEALRGRVVEAGSGAPVPGAVVTLLGPAHAALQTDAAGAWLAPALVAGAYRLRVSHPGFAPREVEVRLPLDAPLRVALTPRPLVLDALVATASRRTQALGDAAVITEVVTGAELERSGASDLAAALSGRPGLDVQGGHPSGSGIMLQGLGAERVLVLVDGEPVVGRLSGQLDLSRLPAAGVERVEVIKGPQSVLYGSDAMGGVVNVITRAPSSGERQGHVSLVAGSHGRTDGSLGWLGSAGPLAWSLAGGVRSAGMTPGVRSTQDALTTRVDGLGRVTWQPSDALRLEGSVSRLDERLRWRSGQLFAFADNLQWSGRLGAQLRAGAHRLMPGLHHAEFEHLARRGTTPHPAAGTGDREAQRRSEASLLYGWSARAHALDAGLEVSRESIASDRVEGERRATVAADLFAQHTWQAGRWSLVPGARLSLSEHWGEHLTPRLAVMLRAGGGVSLRASAGTGYRAPSFKELYMAFANSAAGYRVRGNPELRPESSRNVTVGAEWAGSRAYARVQGFLTRYRDFIETRQVESDDAAVLYAYGNIDDGRTSGVEASAGVASGPFRVEGGYSRLWTRDEALDLPLLGRPDHTARASLEWAHPAGTRARVSGSFTGRAPVARDEDAVTFREALLSLDARVSQALPRNLEVSLGAQNLLDRTPASWPGFAGRQLYVGLGWNSRGSR